MMRFSLAALAGSVSSVNSISYTDSCSPSQDESTLQQGVKAINEELTMLQLANVKRRSSDASKASEVLTDSEVSKASAGVESLFEWEFIGRGACRTADGGTGEAGQTLVTANDLSECKHLCEEQFSCGFIEWHSNHASNNCELHSELVPELQRNRRWRCWHLVRNPEPPNPIHCSVKAETSSQRDAETATGASVRFSVDGVWSTPRVIAESMSLREVVTAEQMLPGRPDAIRIIAAGDDAWGYKRLSVSCGRGDSWGSAATILNSENGEPYGDSRYWVDTDSPRAVSAPASQEYAIPGRIM